jgi:hypothetical protein
MHTRSLAYMHTPTSFFLASHTNTQGTQHTQRCRYDVLLPLDGEVVLPAVQGILATVGPLLNKRYRHRFVLLEFCASLTGYSAVHIILETVALSLITKG